MILESSSLVLAGAWNTAILSPDWIARQVLNQEQGQPVSVLVAFPLGFGMPPSFRLEGVVYQIFPDRVTLAPPTWADESLNQVEQLAIGIAGKLPYTPLVGVGQNFDLVLEDPDVQLAAKFAVDDAIATELDETPSVIATKIVKSFRFDGCILNLTQALSAEGHMQLKFNFHYDIKLAGEIGTVLTGESFRQNKTRALEVLRKVFDTNASDITETANNEHQLPTPTAQQPG
ncbi:MAG: hypothetical protein E6R14_07455 [Thermomicrobiales bacterium]|jgi:hypothetical protein|nr:MAG: hypothetical protein E6R14_07455 [Thermomicrobiales bacterium]